MASTSGRSPRSGKDCVPTDFSLDGETITLCPTAGKEGKTDPVERLSEVKFAFSNYSNIKVYKGSLKKRQNGDDRCLYNSTYIQNAVCAKCGKVENLRTTAARVMDSTPPRTSSCRWMRSRATLTLVNADGTKTPIDVSIDEARNKAFFQLNTKGGAKLIEMVANG